MSVTHERENKQKYIVFKAYLVFFFKHNSRLQQLTNGRAIPFVTTRWRNVPRYPWTWLVKTGQEQCINCISVQMLNISLLRHGPCTSFMLNLMLFQMSTINQIYCQTLTQIMNCLHVFSVNDNQNPVLLYWIKWDSQATLLSMAPVKKIVAGGFNVIGLLQFLSPQSHQATVIKVANLHNYAIQSENVVQARFVSIAFSGFHT